MRRSQRPWRPMSLGESRPTQPRSQSALSADWRSDSSNDQSQRADNGERTWNRESRGGPRGRGGSNRGYNRERGFVIPSGAAVDTNDNGVARSRAGFQNRGNMAGGGRRQDYTPREMTFSRLRNWAQMEDAGELVLFMSSQKQQLETFLNQPLIRSDWLALLVESVKHAITAQHQKESIKQLLDTLCKNRFFEHFTTYIQEKQMLGNTWTEAEEFFKSLIEIMEEVLDKLPMYAIKCVIGSTTLLNTAPIFESIQNNQTLMDTITNFSKRTKDAYLVEKDKEKRGPFLGNNDSEKPADNFIDIPVVPTRFDLRADVSPFIRKAKTMGEYDDVQHYLDVQFRLMRQDFIFPLREGITEFKKNGCSRNYNCSDLRMYYDVHIVGYVLKDGIDHILQFDISKLKNVKWEFSKRLIFGSLVCLSKDNFETAFFATVAHRDAKNLVKGNVNVKFKTGLDEVFNSTSNDVYVMAETTAYFESYCHVLEGLKEMSKTLPLQDYIIKCKKEIRPPRYLLPSQGHFAIPTYDLSALMKVKKVPIEVPVLTTVKWPDTDVMCLNKSQKEAAILALTKELAVIQGPPGTGKTYVGLKVMQVLIENMETISISEKDNSPVLVVCYTNHALDQFLEGVLEFCPGGIVRVGGKNSSEKLEPFNIKNLKLKIRKEKLFSNISVRNSTYESQKDLEVISEKMTILNQTMNALETDVVSESTIEDVMDKTHFHSLTRESSMPSQFLTRQSSKPGYNKTNLRKWLNASEHSPNTMMPQMIKKHLTALVLRWRDLSQEPQLTADMTIFQRASFYHIYLQLFRQGIIQELQFLLSQNVITPPVANRIKELKAFLATTEERILDDRELEIVLPQEAMNRIMYFLGRSDRQEEAYPERNFESWLLGLDKNLHSQLDDVQILSNVLSGEMINSEMFDDDDATKQAQNDRIFDDDDEDDHKGYSTRSHAAMENMSSVIQRAHMLGIKEDILTEDGDKDDGWQTVSHSKPMSFLKFQKKLKATEPMTTETESSIANVWELDLNQRFALYNLWIKRYKEILTSRMNELVNQYTSAYERKKEANNEEVLFILRSAKVIGMTTTGAAKHRAVLQSLGCRIIVVEEAAEVLESHIVTSLNKNCKHLILIGDHQQLRPSPTVFVLAKEFGLEISLFERLIKNKVPHVLLKEQHRMRPEISKIMQHIYPDLQDHVSVKSYDNIRGVSKNMFFIQHEHKETHVDDSRSKANIHEAKFLVALCQYFLNQGYSESEITVLATYAGQVFAIKKVMKDINFNHRVRVTAVDNFQGEENEIILLSLVRSNTENNVGFLKVDNRVCVALSRARKGLFVIGNFNLLASQSTLWKNIIETVNQEQAIGVGLPVVCQNHLEFKQIMTCVEDFDKCPDGGCGRNCEYKLKCGHVCGRRCHGFDLEHTDYQCRKSCSKKCTNGHPCQRKCFQDCGSCMVKIQKYIPACGHDDDVQCSVPVEKADCSQKCDFVLKCEHVCPGKCGKCRRNKDHEKCVVPVTYVWPCEHAATVPCFMKPTLYPCQKLCGADLECGHKCEGKCTECLQGSVHKACVKRCEKRLPCGHKCPSYCGAPCLPCTEVCPEQCRHGACAKGKTPQRCNHICTPCKEPCLHRCAHNTQCKKLCSDTCDICSNSCKQIMKNCGHPCSGLCGEICVCKECETVHILYDDKANDKVLAGSDNDEKKVAAHNNESDTTDTSNQETHTKMTQKSRNRLLIKIPSCYHTFYVDELDKYVINFDPNGTSYIICPKCSKPIMKCMRYGSTNNERHAKREAAKNKLKLKTEVTMKEKRNLLMSLKVIEDSVLMSGILATDVKSLSNKAEVQAVSFKMKCAFILTEIKSLMKESSDTTQFLKIRKDAILEIKNRVTNQQKSEFTREFLRCFWMHYLVHLENLASTYDINLPQSTIDTVKESKVDLGNLKPNDDKLTRAKLVANILRRRINELTTEETVKAKCILLEEAAARTVKVMESQDEDMLCDLVGGEMDNPVKKTFSFGTKKQIPLAASKPTARLPHLGSLFSPEPATRLSNIYGASSNSAATRTTSDELSKKLKYMKLDDVYQKFTSNSDTESNSDTD